jgi:hypothetical protein
MSYLPHANSFRDLVAYQKAKALAKEIFQLSKRFPREETAEYFAKSKED